jgi:Ca2+-binding RTX toxin-like protein
VGVSQARSESVIQILDGAQAADKAVIQAKVLAAIQFSQQVGLLDLSNEYGNAGNTALFSGVRDWLSEIDSKSTSALSSPQIKAASVAILEKLGTPLGDAIVTSVDWAGTLDWQRAADIENLFATGTRAVSLVGNDQTNLMSGNGAGSRLTGGAGADIFWFDENTVSSPDRILDFNPDEDLVGIDSSLFIGLNRGPLSQADFDAKFRFDGKTLYLGNQPVYEITLTSGTFTYSDIWVF